MSMRSTAFLRAAIIAGTVLSHAALSTASADTVVVSADRTSDRSPFGHHHRWPHRGDRAKLPGSARRASRRSERDDAAAGIDRHAYASDLRPALQRLSPTAIYRQLLDGGRRGQRQENTRGRVYHGAQRGFGQL